MKVLLICFCLFASSSAQISKEIVECCGMTLQDANRNIALEASKPLGPATYTALIVRACSQEQFNVQVWTQITADSFRLKWQLAVAPTVNQTMYGPVVISFDTQPLTVDNNDRFGLFMSTSKLNKLPVPFATLSDAAVNLVHLNTTEQAIPGLVVSLVGSVSVPARSFSAFIKFCETPYSCPSLTGNLNPPVPANYLPYISIPSYCCDKMVACDANNNLTNQLNYQIELINTLITTIMQLQLYITSITNSTVISGRCPSDFEGVSNIGFCYKFLWNPLQLAEAAVSCNSFYRSRVVFILSKAEEDFIYNFLVQRNMTAEFYAKKNKFWTSALFNDQQENWNWYNYQLLRNDVIKNYKNWKNGFEPVPRSDFKDERCATFSIDFPNYEKYWEIANCSQPHFYICKLPKKCD